MVRFNDDYVRGLLDKSEEAYRDLSRDIKHIVGSRNMIPGKIEDIVQEVLIDVLRGIHTYDKSKSQFTTWIHTLIRRREIDAYRSHTKFRRVQERYARDNLRNESTSPDNLIELENEEEKNLLQKAIPSLTKLEREIMSYHYGQGIPLHIIKEIMTVPIGTVKSKLFRGRAKLKSKLEEAA